MAYDDVDLIPREEDDKVEGQRAEGEVDDLTEEKPMECKEHEEEVDDETSSSADSGSDDDLHKKSVRWSTVTVYEFGVAIGGSAIPRRGGPSIGLARRPKSIWSASVDDVEDETLSDEEDSWLHNVPERQTKHREDLKRTRHDPVRTQVARRRRVRWLKPLERVELLTSAGCSEKRIYRTMMESSEIAMSRRLCVSVLRSV